MKKKSDKKQKKKSNTKISKKEKAQISHEVISDDVESVTKRNGSIKKSEDENNFDRKLIESWINSSRAALTPSLDQIATAPSTPIGNLNALRSIQGAAKGNDGNYIETDKRYESKEYVAGGRRSRDMNEELTVTPTMMTTPSDFIQSSATTRRGITIKTDLDFVDTPKTDYTTRYDPGLGNNNNKKKMPFEIRKEYEK